MKTIFAIIISIAFVSVCFSGPESQFESDTINTSSGDLVITFIGHGTLMFEFKNMIIHADPVSGYADYMQLPKADIILVTHHHGDHLDPKAIQAITRDNTEIVLTSICYEKIKTGIVLNNGDTTVIKGFSIFAVPAYNLVHKRDTGEPFHPKGIGNGYVVSFDDKKVYIAGDTENVPEMKNLKDIDIAFLPMNLPYTMTPEMVANAVDMINPEILYPYHFGETDTNVLINLLKDKYKGEVRIRNLQ